MKRFSTFVLTLLSVFTVYAQTISVSSFKLLETDLTANTVGTMETDQNGETAALIKVVTTQTGFAFDGGVLGIVKTKQTPGEIWVYIPRGSKKISIKHPQLGVLRDYYFPIAIEAARTYEMVLVSGELQTIVKQARTSQYVVFQITPKNAVVELDGELLQTKDGTATKMMKFGTYNYRVQAPNYLPEAGNVTVNDPKNKHVVNVSLKPNSSVVILKVEDEAEIWVNGERMGVGSWTGNLSPGTYEFETRKQNHRTVSLTRDIIDSSEPQTIVLQAPIPIFGEADINSSPAMADIYIDGKMVGQTPQLFSDLTVGQHQLRISKQGFYDYVSALDISELEATKISINLEELNNSSISIDAGNTSFKMVYVEKGSFEMGKIKIGDYFDDKETVHNVKLSSYYIGETEVTQELWESVMGYNPSVFKNKKAPVENVSWNDCQLFIEKLNKLTKLKFRLPTEAEWEYAAKGGILGNDYAYSGSNEIDKVAWYSGNTGKTTCEVKQKSPNELGIYDMTGNVQEWCQDWYEHYTVGAVSNPKGPKKGVLRVFRGGGWNILDGFCRVTARRYAKPDEKYDNLGLRIVLEKAK